MKFFNSVVATLALTAIAGCAAPQGNVAAPPSAPIEAQPVAANKDTDEPISSDVPVSWKKIVRRSQVPDGVPTISGLTVPRSFEINVFAEGLQNPRRLTIAPKSTPEKWDVFVAESRANRVRVLRDAHGDGTADEKFVFSDKLDQPYGLAFHPSGFLYVGNTANIVRLPYKDGATTADAQPEKIADLTRGGYNQHWTRNLIFSPDAKKLYATVGSSCNTCEENDAQRAAISVMNPDGSARRIFASGLRNAVGLAWRPDTSELWAVVNERDNLGDDVPPDYATHVKDGAFYGWPYAYTDIDGVVTADPSFGDRNPQKVRATVPPTVPVQAHSAALGITFYPTTKLSRGFPAEYKGDAFLAYHGSWNRGQKTGYKIVRVHFQNDKAISVTDFVSGFLKDGAVSGRPVDVAIAPDGSLLFTDDGSGKIWRVSYRGVKSP